MKNQSRQHGSQTAEIVTVSRAHHFARGIRPLVFEDQYAIHFLSEKWRQILSSSFKTWLFIRIFMRKLMPTASYVLFRALYSEDRILNAIQSGTNQLVILGAGFDTFSLRYPDLNVQVFEVDLPTTANQKRERLAAAHIPIPKHLNFVSVDFEHDDLSRKLAAAGFDSQKPAVFNWMGVTYYLEKNAILETLAKLKSLASSGSELIFDYLVMREQLTKKGQSSFDALTRFVQEKGEPMLSPFNPMVIQQELGLIEKWDILGHEDLMRPSKDYLAGRTDQWPLPPFFRLLHLQKK